jgi:hypothetical protein
MWQPVQVATGAVGEFEAQRPRMFGTALLAYLTFAVYHLAFHASHPRHFPPAGAVAQTGVLALGVAVPLVLLVPTRRRGR